MNKITTLFFAAILFSFITKAQNFSVTSGSLASSTISSCDSTIITINTYLGCINWTMGPSSYAVSGNNIEVRVDYTSSFICAGAISNPVFTQSVSNLTAGTYAVTATAFLDNNKGNSVGLGNLTVTQCTVTGIESPAEQKRMNIFPNPAKEFVSVENFSGKQLQYQLIDISGRAVMSGVVKNKTSKLDIRSLNSGIYFLRYQMNNESVVQKLIVR